MMRFYKLKSINDIPSWISNHPMGDQIRTMRESLGMTQEQLAERSGLTQSVIADIENGRRNNLQLSTVQKLATALNCEPLFQMIPKKDIHQILDEKSTEMARKIVSATSGSAAIEMQLPNSEVVNAQMMQIKKEILEKHRSILWQK